MGWDDGQGQVAGGSEHVNETTASINCGNFLTQ
jgi:hypothetical protein